MATMSDFVKGTDCGYSDRTLLCHKAGGTSIYKGNGGKWVLARVRNGVCWHSREYRTRREAIANA